jgi:hypothetical protein
VAAVGLCCMPCSWRLWLWLLRPWVSVLQATLFDAGSSYYVGGAVSSTVPPAFPQQLIALLLHLHGLITATRFT